MSLNERLGVTRFLAITLVASVSLAPFSNANAYGHSDSVEKNPYPYCNVYLTDLCFGIASGDALTMRIPVDVVLYGIKLSNGADVSVFDGYLPTSPFDGKSPKACSAKLGYRCAYTASSSRYDILYQAKPNSTIVVIRVRNINASNRDYVNSFILNFRPCTARDQSEKCTNKHLFYGVTK